MQKSQYLRTKKALVRYENQPYLIINARYSQNNPYFIMNILIMDKKIVSNMKVANMSSVNKLGKRVSKDVVSKNPEKIRNNILTLDRTKKRLKEQILIIINFNVIIV